MLTVRNYSLSGDRQVLRGDAVVIFNSKDDPIVMVVTVSPTLTQVYSVDKPEEFGRALKQHGVDLPSDISDMKL